MNASFPKKGIDITDRSPGLCGLYLLLICELIVVLSSEPQSVHNSGIETSYQSGRNSNEGQPSQPVSLFHPFIWP